MPDVATTPDRWVDAADLLLLDVQTDRIEVVYLYPFRDKVYNFEVEDLHCYAVGRPRVLVRNNNGPEMPAPNTFSNKLPERLAGELADAAKVGAKPIQFGDPGFNRAVNSGTIKYVVTESGEVIITPHTVKGVEISHAVLSDGQDVIAAGEAEIAVVGDKYVGIDLNFQSGHYLPSAESLQAAREAFGKIGIAFP